MVDFLKNTSRPNRPFCDAIRFDLQGSKFREELSGPLSTLCPFWGFVGFGVQGVMVCHVFGIMGFWGRGYRRVFFLRDPRKWRVGTLEILRAGREDPQGGPAGGAPGHWQDPAGEGCGRRGEEKPGPKRYGWGTQSCFFL